MKLVLFALALTFGVSAQADLKIEAGVKAAPIRSVTIRKASEPYNGCTRSEASTSRGTLTVYVCPGDQYNRGGLQISDEDGTEGLVAITGQQSSALIDMVTQASNECPVTVSFDSASREAVSVKGTCKKSEDSAFSIQ